MLLSKKICLITIVKNESKIIQRLLKSVLPIIDYVCITDTGSSDDTIEKINEFMNTTNIPYKVCDDIWIDFGYNRTESVKNGQKSFPDSNYFLLLDADMVLIVKKSFDKNMLDICHYSILQKNNSIEYYNLRMIPNGYEWKCIGRTHEYWDRIKSLKDKNCKHLFINDIGDGGSKNDKYERDYKFLLKDIEENIDAPRSYFYLAQTCSSLKKYDESIEYYNKRSLMGDFEEEAWISLLRIGEIYEQLEKYDESIVYYLKSFRRRPHRAESSYRLANVFYILRDYLSCYHYATIAYETKYPSDDILFIDKESYSFGPLFLLNISCFYVKKYEEGLKYSNKLLELKNIPDKVRELAEDNKKYYLK